MTKIPRIRLFNSVVKDKMPNPETSKIGEIYINANAERPFLSTKTSDGGMVKVIAEDEINTKIQAEATARQEADKAISDSIKNIDLSNKADVSALTQEISDRKQEDARIEGKITDETTARENAVNDLTTSINDLKENGGKVQDVKVNGVSVVANKVANIDLTSKADATALTEVSTAVESKADNAALSKEIDDRKSEITRVEGLIPTDTLSADELTKDEKAIAAAFQEIKINYDAQQLTINNLKKKVQEASKNQGGGKVDDVKVNGVSVVANKIANIDLSNKADATALTQVSAAIESKADTTALTEVSKSVEAKADSSALTQVSEAIESKADKTALTEVSKAVEAKADSSALTQVSTALTKEISDRKSEITRVEGLIQGGGGSSSGGVSTDELTDDEQTIAAAFQEQKINIDALRLSIETLKKRISSLEKALKAKA